MRHLMAITHRNRTNSSMRVVLALATICGLTLASGGALRTPASAAPAQGNPATTGNEQGVSLESFNRKVEAVRSGPFHKIYDPAVYNSEKGVSEPWLINDHTFVRSEDGTWHLFGITHKEPPAPGIVLAHATAPSLNGPWTKQPMVMKVDRDYYGETHVWAPYIVQRGDTYYMFYSGGGEDPTSNAISVATSKDLFHWKRLPNGPLFRDGWVARDPMVRRIGDRWVMYYEATRDPSGGKYIVAYRTSTDLLHWSDRHIAFTSSDKGRGAGDTESPFVAYHDGSYYLFIGPCGGYRGEQNKYNCTDVYRSENPLRFSTDQHVGRINAHAPEIVHDANGTPYISHSGWGQGGVYLARLRWDQVERQRGVRVTTGDYKVELLTSPVTVMTALRRKTDDGYGRNLLDTGYRGTRPFIGVGGWGNIVSGRAQGVKIDRENNEVTLRDIPLGRQPITVDWSLRFSPRWFDVSLDWHVARARRMPRQTTAQPYAAGWTLDTTLPKLADTTGRKRKTGTPYGFPDWTMATGDSISLVTAYKRGSAWEEYARYFNPRVGAINWQSISSSWGYNWAPGRYDGGTWRVGMTDQPHDVAFAERLYESLND